MEAQPRYDYSKIKLENLNRGLVCTRVNDSICVSWRLLKSDNKKIAFNVYANGNKLNDKPISDRTYIKTKDIFTDSNTEGQTVFCVKTLLDGVETIDNGATYILNNVAKGNYITVPLNKPANGKVPVVNNNNQNQNRRNNSRPRRIDDGTYTYSANDASVGDVDGDGEYEIILKWEPSNAHDNSHEGYTGNVIFDCYKLNGKHLWRIDLGKNIRAGAHYTQFMVYDLDCDGKAELVMKTADGTRDGVGNIIGDSTANHVLTGKIEHSIENKVANSQRNVIGRILSGPEYLTVFNGETGAAMCTVDYIPERGELSDWGDTYGNRSERYLACIAYLDGIHPSVVMCRGYYTKSYLAAWDWDGKELKLKWLFDSKKIDEDLRVQANSTKKSKSGKKDKNKTLYYSGQGNHNIRVADVDGDGCDEITYGSMCVDHDGTGLYTTGMGHGDAIHQYAFYPNSDKLQIWDVHENRKDGSDFRDAKTGKVIFQIPAREDVGRGMAADIDPTIKGVEMWSITQHGFYDVNGKLHAKSTWIPMNSAVWWDGDLLRELLDRHSVMKYNWRNESVETLLDFRAEGYVFNNGTKQNPCLSADIFGDWREEVMVRNQESTELRIYTTDIPTNYRYVTFMHDIPYRISVATENVAYNQPPEPGFYFGEK